MRPSLQASTAGRCRYSDSVAGAPRSGSCPRPDARRKPAGRFLRMTRRTAATARARSSGKSSRYSAIDCGARRLNIRLELFIDFTPSDPFSLLRNCDVRNGIARKAKILERIRPPQANQGVHSIHNLDKRRSVATIRRGAPSESEESLAFVLVTAGVCDRHHAYRVESQAAIVVAHLKSGSDGVGRRLIAPLRHLSRTDSVKGNAILAAPFRPAGEALRGTRACPDGAGYETHRLSRA